MSLSHSLVTSSLDNVCPCQPPSAIAEATTFEDVENDVQTKRGSALTHSTFITITDSDSLHPRHRNKAVIFGSERGVRDSDRAPDWSTLLSDR